ncbi:MAG: alpha/beta hydrolase [Promethearchaeota archaeon]
MELKPKLITNLFKISAYILLTLNFLAIVVGIIYRLQPRLDVIWNFTGNLFLITIILNIIFAFFESKIVRLESKQGKRINLGCYGYFVFVVIAMLSSFSGNFLYSVSYSFSIIENLPYISMIYLGYFGPLIYAMILDYAIIYGIELPEINKFAEWKGIDTIREDIQIIKTKKIIKIVIRIASALFLGFLAIFAYSLLNGAQNMTIGMIGIMSGQYSLFYLIMSLATMTLAIKTLKTFNFKRSPISGVQFTAFLIVGIVLSSIFSLPLLNSSAIITNAEKNFSTAFGSDWRDKIDPSAEEHMLKGPLALPGYFLEIPHNTCIIEKDISFYNGTSGVDIGLKLYFDAYLPPNKGLGLPGGNTTIIRIHGGGWMIGDKGRGNMLQMNKYLASQGYCVFDVQYGLYENGPWKMPIITPDYVLGDFNITDMMRHLGIFTKYLIANASRFGARLDSVFISGGSAGGQLTCALGLAIASGNYTSMFGSDITIKGIIPFYPANFIEGRQQFLDGLPEFLNPELLITSSSPPCLIFQGEQDGLVLPYVSESFQEAYYAKNNTECAIIWMPFAGHAADLHFSGIYNQIFLYYMERFIYIYK